MTRSVDSEVSVGTVTGMTTPTPDAQRPIRLEWQPDLDHHGRNFGGMFVMLDGLLLLQTRPPRNGRVSWRVADADHDREGGATDQQSAQRAAEACAESLLRQALATLTGATP